MTTQTRQELLRVLAELGEQFPDMRLGQLLANVAYWARGPANESVWDATDEELLAAAKELLKRQKTARPSVA